MNAAKHFHKYIRVPLNKRRKIDGAKVYKCVTPGCTHFIAEHLAEGRVNLCWVCDEPFSMTRKSMKLKKPHCEKCYSRTDLRGQLTKAVVVEKATKDWSEILRSVKEES